jgi:hypothetical protein
MSAPGVEAAGWQRPATHRHGAQRIQLRTKTWCRGVGEVAGGNRLLIQRLAGRAHRGIYRVIHMAILLAN